MARRIKTHDADTIAFTATGRGLTPRQLEAARLYLGRMRNQGYWKVRHGDCVGGDAQLARLAKDLGFYLICHPGFPPNRPDETKYRAFTDFNDEILEPRPFLIRDKDMVDKGRITRRGPVSRL